MAFNLQDIIGGSITDGVAKIISLFKVDPNLALAHQTELEKLQFELQTKILDATAQQAIAQAEVNKAEASSGNRFAANWRPLVGYIAGVGLGIQFIIGPLCTWIAALCGHPVAFPILDLGALTTLLFGMLGLSSLRTYEKVQGVDAGH